MDINFFTEKLIVTTFQPLAGGKFINMALALHPNILFQDEKLARLKMMGKQDIEKSFQTTSSTFSKKIELGQHIEYGCEGLAGFHGGMLDSDIKADEKNCNQLWIELTNQQKYYFFMVDCSPGDEIQFKRYPNRKTLRLKNHEWIIDQRGGSPAIYNKPDLPNSFCFDMSSIKDSIAFRKEIYSVLDFLGLALSDAQVFESYLEHLRKGFLQTYKIGFESGENL